MQFINKILSYKSAKCAAAFAVFAGNGPHDTTPMAVLRLCCLFDISLPVFIKKKNTKNVKGIFLNI